MPQTAPLVVSVPSRPPGATRGGRTAELSDLRRVLGLSNGSEAKEVSIGLPLLRSSANKFPRGVVGVVQHRHTSEALPVFQSKLSLHLRQILILD